MVWVFPPALYGAYERGYHESWGNVCQRVFALRSWLPTQLEYWKEKKWYEEQTDRALIAPCDTRDRTSYICESEQNVSVVERQGVGDSKYMVKKQ
jgi:hypothetical protein